MACTKETVKPSGLNIWSSGAKTRPEPAVDIIAVQALDAHPYYTWVENASKTAIRKPERRRDKVRFRWDKALPEPSGKDGAAEVMWLRDTVPQIFENARLAATAISRIRGTATSKLVCENALNGS
ncbi:hypothetical protein B0O99DRAFT_640491 [Bisporella sp. PMI_857]|nr:hypothetical protein B0O99DRAFT_640491 [Bisporella sp. PMI_857]